MKLNLSIDVSAVEKKLQDVQKALVTTKAFSKTAQQGINVILNRTEKGLGYERPFKAYHPAYAKYREDKGRRSAPVDLNFSGKMLSSIRSKAAPRSAEIYFSRAAEAKKAIANNRIRPFFGFSEREKAKLVRFFWKQIKI
jgi:hypothetical protein